MLYEKILNEREQLQHQIESIQSELAQLPDGKLICASNQGHYKWYRSDGHSKNYIPKKDRVIAEQLARKKYLSCLLDELLTEKNALDQYLLHHSNTAPQSDYLLHTHPAYRELLSSLQPEPDFISKWLQMPFQSNPFHPENLIHKTASGKMVRSKSEVLIDLVLTSNHIPFHYESALVLGNSTIYPDFTILHPKTGKIFYWEHFGSMDDPVYQQSVIKKLSSYIKHGFIPSINLITTYETRENPLSLNTVQQIVDSYFL